jgi:quinoprotein glucose dehydrogenase
MHAAGKGLAAVAATIVLVASIGPARAQRLPGVSDAAMAALASGEWPAYAGTYAAAKYSPLDQINADNVRDLQIAWRWTSPDHDLRFATPGIDPSAMNEATPLMIGGVLYTSTSLSQVAAIDAATGKTKWVYDPGVYVHGMPANLGWVHRGVAYWRDGEDERIVILAAHAFMVALDAKSVRSRSRPWPARKRSRRSRSRRSRRPSRSRASARPI